MGVQNAACSAADGIPDVIAIDCRYQLLHTVRVHTGADDDAYSCMGWGPDQEGINGVWLHKDIPLQVGAA